MQIDENIKKYLSGEEFSNGGKFKFYDSKHKGNRIEVITSIISEGSKNKNLVHLGCCDHLNLIEQKIRENRWLHKILMENSNDVVGFDIDNDTVEYVNSIGYNNVYSADLITEVDKVKQLLNTNIKWDYLIAGEIIEHVDNPILFLENISNSYKECIDRILITVPNALSFQNIKFALIGEECINTDHRYWFTPYTISKILYRAGIEIEHIYFADRPKVEELEEYGIDDQDIFAMTLIVIGKFV